METPTGAVSWPGLHPRPWGLRLRWSISSVQPQEPLDHPEPGLRPRAAPEVNGRGSSGPARSGHSANVNRHHYPVSQDPLATRVVLCNLVLGAGGLSSGLGQTLGPLLQVNVVWLDGERGGSGAAPGGAVAARCRCRPSGHCSGPWGSAGRGSAGRSLGGPTGALQPRGQGAPALTPTRRLEKNGGLGRWEAPVLHPGHEGRWHRVRQGAWGRSPYIGGDTVFLLQLLVGEASPLSRPWASGSLWTGPEGTFVTRQANRPSDSVVG